MPLYLIERNIPGAGKLSPDDLKAISQKSCGVLSELGGFPADRASEIVTTIDPTTAQ
ncbi:hypothetical protein [Gemmatimonas groenlandica]|uniref:DUF4242 domain-containing protein n=1 Tax=Gemmatimonas groenlandica TaxID=2732249 RepID=A0A6M4IQL5_9BACT|nr:hypothetical protein [Gemmatimonas groenlandica]QJR37214.1 hypothetical protein HKW67_17665 [Gemmatimonas groenlandica]